MREPTRQDPLGSPEQLRAMDLDVLTQIIERYVTRELHHYLDVPPAHRLCAQRPLSSLGVDSLLALLLKRRLESALHVPVRAPQLLRDDTLAQLAAGLAVRVRWAAVNGTLGDTVGAES